MALHQVFCVSPRAHQQPCQEVSAVISGRGAQYHHLVSGPKLVRGRIPCSCVSTPTPFLHPESSWQIGTVQFLSRIQTESAFPFCVALTQCYHFLAIKTSLVAAVQLGLACSCPYHRALGGGVHFLLSQILWTRGKYITSKDERIRSVSWFVWARSSVTKLSLYEVK